MVLITTAKGCVGLEVLTKKGPTYIGQYGITDSKGSPVLYEWNGDRWISLRSGKPS